MELAATQQLIREPERRGPRRADAWLFFIVAPIAVALVLAMIGNRLIVGMAFIDALGYMVAHMLLSWWSVSAGAWAMRGLCRPWQPSVTLLVIGGFLFALVPTALLFQLLGDFYGELSPEFAANRQQTVLPQPSLHYLGHFLRYSLPAVPLFLVGVIGYRFATGVDWLGYPAVAPSLQGTGSNGSSGSRASALEQHPPPPLAGSLPGTRLPSDALLTAIKAEQHYIRIWSDQGADFLRYRFRDLGATFAASHAAPVHRSWWVNFDHVTQMRPAGRSVELLMDNGLVVPVSLSHKAAVLEAVARRPPA
jgi:hypothetical protein